MVFSTLFHWSLNFAVRSWWSEPQSAPGLVFADLVELLHLQLQRKESVWFWNWPSGDVHAYSWVGKGCLVWPTCYLLMSSGCWSHQLKLVWFCHGYSSVILVTMSVLAHTCSAASSYSLYFQAAVYILQTLVTSAPPVLAIVILDFWTPNWTFLVLFLKALNLLSHFKQCRTY